MSLEDDVKSWLTSKTILGSLFAGVATIAGAYFKVEFPLDFATQMATDIATLFGVVFAIYGRITAVKKIK